MSTSLCSYARSQILMALQPWLYEHSLASRPASAQASLGQNSRGAGRLQRRSTSDVLALLRAIDKTACFRIRLRPYDSLINCAAGGSLIAMGGRGRFCNNEREIL